MSIFQQGELRSHWVWHTGSKRPCKSSKPKLPASGVMAKNLMEIHHVFFFPLCDLFVCSNQRFFLHYHHWHSEVLATPQFPTSFQQGPVLTNSQFSICDPNDGLTASKQLTSSTATTMRKRSSHQAGFSWYLVVSCGISTILYISLLSFPEVPVVELLPISQLPDFRSHVWGSWGALRTRGGGLGSGKCL